VYALTVPNSEYQERVAIALKAAAFYRSVTKAELAGRIGASVESVRRWMRAQRSLSAEDAAKLADALDVPSDLLLRPPATRERAMAMLTAWDEAGEAGER
jgi:transcriptional regulator with XRE-family HTH domain